MPTISPSSRLNPKARGILGYFEGLLTPAFVQWIESAVANNTYSDGALFEKVRKSAPCFEGYTWSKGSKTAVLDVSEDLAEQWGIHPRVELDFLVASRLMREGRPALDCFLANYAQVFREEVARLLKTWLPAKPAWVPEQAVVRWALEKTRQGEGYRTHPMELALLSLDGPELRRAGVLPPSASTRPAVRGLLTIQIAGIACSLETKIPWADFVRALWLCKKATLAEAIDGVLLELCRAPQAHLQCAVDEFCEGGLCLHPPAQDLATMGFTRDEWAHMVADLLRGHSLERAEDFAQRVQRKVDHRRREMALQDCARTLPERLSDLYPVARSLQRKLTLVVGPTNSGKTYRAVERMKRAASSLYLGPLRLLALEIRDRLDEEGIPTNLVTGELVEQVDGATVTASTIEMLDFERPVDVVVIDEVQMMADPQRGSAWVQAILGAPAREVWMLGSPEALDAVQALAAYLQEPLTIVNTERLSPLSVDKAPTSLGEIPAKSAVVAFSRREVLDIATELREQHGRKVSVIYGALSPEVRRDQADKFRSGENDIVVATDAISMGLNLPVHRMYFSTAVKWNGVEEEPIPADLTWQIAGRAGRFGHHDQGHVGALDRQALQFVQATLRERPQAIDQVFRHGPTWPLVSAIATALDVQSLADVLKVFLKDFRLAADKRFISAIGEEQLNVAEMVDRYTLSLRTKLTLSNAPLPLIKGEIPAFFSTMTRAIERGQPLAFGALSDYHRERAGASQMEAEYAVKVLTLYCWMHYRFAEVFPDFDLALGHIDALNEAISRHLGRAKSRQCKSCTAALRVRNPHPLCDKCFRASRGWTAFS